MSLIINNLSCGYGKKPLVENISFSVEEGEIVCLLGPNGVGKTTFFRVLLGFLRPLSGSIVIDGKDARNLSRRQLARHIAYVPQTMSQSFAYTVYDMILMGRASFIRGFSSYSKEDRKICDDVIKKLRLSPLQDKLFTQISGGEQQLTLIARAMVQRPEIIMMDEPTSNLDYGNQALVLEQIFALAKEGYGILMITHSPDQALLSADKVVLFGRDNHTSIGNPHEIMTQETLEEVYGIKVLLVQTKSPSGETIWSCIPNLRKY